MRNWHQVYKEESGFADRVTDVVANLVGSWKFVVFQTALMIFWIVINIVVYWEHWDPYPFILLSLFFNAQAAYTAPIIVMAQNRQSDRDRHQAEIDYETNREAKGEIEELQKSLKGIELEKLDRIIELLEKKKEA